MTICARDKDAELMEGKLIKIMHSLGTWFIFYSLHFFPSSLCSNHSTVIASESFVFIHFFSL